MKQNSMDALGNRLRAIDNAIAANKTRKLLQRDWREEGVLRLELIDLKYKRQSLQVQMARLPKTRESGNSA